MTLTPIDYPSDAVIADGGGARSGQRFANVSPIDGRVLAQVALGSEDDVDRAVRLARKEFESGGWPTLSPAQRGAALIRLAALVEEHAAELALLEVLDTGKPLRDATSVDIPGAAKVLRWFGEAVGKRYGEVAPTAASVLATITSRPYGVIAAIVPWNFPLYMAVQKVAPAIATGNCVILKPAEQSPSSAIRLGQLALEAGIPAGVLQVIPGDGPTTGAALATHPGIDAITFTGSTTVGFGLASASHGKPVWTELGGKTAQVVLRDAGDLERIAQAVALGAFYNQGQVCNAGSRLLVDAPIHDRLLDLVLRATERLVVGDPLAPATDLGTLIDDAAVATVRHEVARAIDAGATEVTSWGAAPLSSSAAMRPVILDGVDPASRLAQEEVFGPVLAVTTVDGIDEAIRVANSTRFSLAAAIWTRDIATALAGADRLKAGTVWVNNFDESDITTPWGGVGATGNGRDKSLHALDQYTWLKTTWIALDR